MSFLSLLSPSVSLFLFLPSSSPLLPFPFFSSFLSQGKKEKGGYCTTFRASLQIRVCWCPNSLFQTWIILLIQTYCCTICLHAVWVAKMGTVQLKTAAKRPNHMPCHLSPNYLNILKVKTLINLLFFLLCLNRDIILYSSFPLISFYTSNISLGTVSKGKT